MCPLCASEIVWWRKLLIGMSAFLGYLATEKTEGNFWMDNVHDDDEFWEDYANWLAEQS